MKNNKKPELLVPAGNLEKLKIGLQYGAEAFYMGMPSFSMRSRINNFTEESLAEGMRLIRKAGKAFYITMNIYPRGNKVDAFKKHIKFIREKIKPDGIIVADPGVFELIKEYYPEAVIHMSVQANILNYRAVKFWHNQGAKRIILPRELMLKEIKEIHDNVPDIELEFFVHGAICMAYSGRCLLSNYMTGRDSNQGICAHSCRWKYTAYLEEEQRPGQLMKIEEDAHGSYIMNSKDMCLIPYLKDLYDAGICSFKVEGRNKTEYYLAVITRAYRKAIDDMLAGKKFDKSLITEVSRVANRKYIPGFLFGFPGSEDVYYEKNEPNQLGKFVGIVKGKAKISEKSAADFYEVEIRNRLDAGEEITIITPSKNHEMKIKEMYTLDFEKVASVHGGAGNKILKLVKGLPVNAMLRTNE